MNQKPKVSDPKHFYYRNQKIFGIYFTTDAYFKIVKNYSLYLRPKFLTWRSLDQFKSYPIDQNEYFYIASKMLAKKLKACGPVIANIEKTHINLLTFSGSKVILDSVIFSDYIHHIETETVFIQRLFQEVI